MQLSPIQLLEANFEHISVAPSKSDWPKKTQKAEFSMEINFEFGIAVIREDNDEFEYLLQIKYKTVADKRSSHPYSVDAELSGRVRVTRFAETQTPLNIKATAAVTGCSMLYGSLREMVALISGRCARGAWLLPTMTFAEIGRDIERDGKIEAAAALSESKPARARPKAKKIASKQ